MYGLVNKAVQELVESRFGSAAWEQVKAKAGLDLEIFISNEAYPDDITYRLVGSASAVTGMTPEAILMAFGEHWVLHTSRQGYGALMDAGGRSLPEFLENLPNFHTRVAMIFPKLRPPEFRTSHRTDTSIRLHYLTERQGLTPFVVGLLSGLGKKFDTPIRTSLIERKAEGADHDVFLVEWDPK